MVQSGCRVETVGVWVIAKLPIVNTLAQTANWQNGFNIVHQSLRRFHQNILVKMG
jgi:hypothetical protein